jgi:hypothetical protein
VPLTTRVQVFASGDRNISPKFPTAMKPEFPRPTALSVFVLPVAIKRQSDMA